MHMGMFLGMGGGGVNTYAETSARAHWVFGGSDASLVSRVNGHTLTESGTVSYNAGSVRLQGVNGYLQSDLIDTVDMTLVCVFLRPADDGSNQFALIGNFESSPLSGAYLNQVSSSRIGTAYVGTGPSVFTHNISIPAGITSGEWMGAALSMKFSGGGKDVAAVAGGSYVTDDTTAVTSPSVQNSGFGLRIGHIDAVVGYSANARDIAEAIVFDRALSEAEIALVLNRAKIRQAANGQDVQFA